MSEQSTPKCLSCGGAKVVPILHGMPSPEAQTWVDQGRIVLGGCCVTPEEPNWHCKDCRADFKEGWSEKELITSLGKGDTEQQVLAVKALGSLRAKAALPALEELVKSARDEELRDWASFALEKIRG